MNRLALLFFAFIVSVGASQGKTIEFQTVFADISERSHVGLIVEGIPLHSSLSRGEADSLSDRLAPLENIPSNVAERLNAIADAFGYDVETSSNHLYLLRKKYEDPMDLPCVTDGEVTHALQTVLKIAAPYNREQADKPYGQEMQLLNSLTPQQQKAFQEFAPIASLDTDQQDLAVSIAYSLYWREKLRWITAYLHHMEVIKNPETVFKWVTMPVAGGVEAFGYEGPFGPKGQTWEIALNNGFVSQIGRGKLYTPKNTSTSTLPDPTVPTEQDKELASGMMAHRIASAYTLGEFAKSFAAPNQVTVDENLSDKPVCVFGRANFTPDALIRGCATLYGLQLLVPKEGRYLFAFPLPHATQSIEDVPAEVVRVFPLPLLRALDAQARKDRAELRVKAGFMENPANDVDKMNNTIKDRMMDDDVARRSTDTYYYPAVRRLIALALPMLKKHSGEVPFPSVSPEAQCLDAIAMVSGLPLTDVDAIIQGDLPPIFKQPKSMKIKVVKSADPNEPSVFFGYKTGDFSSGGGSEHEHGEIFDLRLLNPAIH